MTVKMVILAVFSIITGLILLGVGFYFLSEKFIEKLNESTGDDVENSGRKNIFRAKGCGLTAMALGAVTVLWGILLFVFPEIVSMLALIYMILLIAAFSVVFFVFR